MIKPSFCLNYNSSRTLSNLLCCRLVAPGIPQSRSAINLGVAAPAIVTGDGTTALGGHDTLPRERRSSEMQQDNSQQDIQIKIKTAKNMTPHEFAKLNEVRAPAPVENPTEHHRCAHRFLDDSTSHDEAYELTSAYRRTPEESRQKSIGQSPETAGQNQDSRSRDGVRESMSGEQASKFISELYALSYLVLFSILGTLARLGIEALTIYPGNPVAVSALWANFGGSLIMGYLSEDRRLFIHHGDSITNPSAESESESDRNAGTPIDQEASRLEAKKAHMAIKKTIPLYIGLATGFCGSLTSFSTFIRDIFLALSNKAPTIVSRDRSTLNIPRNGGFSFMALLAVIILTLCLCLSALKLGAHLAITAERITPAIPPLFLHKIVDRVAVVLAVGMWLGAVFMAIWPPDRPSGPAGGNISSSQEKWRGWVLWALVFSPVGCIGRFYASVLLNGLSASFPVGTFVVNVFGTIMLGVCWDLQRVPLLAGQIGGGMVSCQVLQGVQDGFCGCLTTVSTWVLELSSLRRRHAYFYGATSVGVSLATLVLIMGSLSWTRGLVEPACSI